MSGETCPKAPYELAFRTVPGSCSLHHSSLATPTDTQTALIRALSIAPLGQEMVFNYVDQSGPIFHAQVIFLAQPFMQLEL